MDKTIHNIDPASFRDPSGFVFEHKGKIYRAIAPICFGHYDLLMNGGLFKNLTDKKLLIPHTEVPASELPPEFSKYRIILPEKVPFISYPYEWCFGQLKSAALLTLSVQLEALKHGLTLKDGSAYNVQFIGPKPVFIDTLSFEKYAEGRPWVAYGQFCRHFLAPLALMAYRSPALSRIPQLYLDGMPLELTDSLLPKRSLLNSTMLSHLHLHAKFLAKAASGKKAKPETNVSISKSKLTALLEHLREGIKNLNLKGSQSAWTNYGQIDNYSSFAKAEKHKVISAWLQKLKPHTTWDLGCNTGEYSLPASDSSAQVISMDSDALCIEALFKQVSGKKSANILPLVVDLANPTPAIGWAGRERKDIPQRGKADMLLALALVHHLRIGNNTPWEMIASLFSDWGNAAIVEYAPENDSQVQRMLSQRSNVYEDLDEISFRRSFEKCFSVQERSALPESGRVLYLLKRKQV